MSRKLAVVVAHPDDDAYGIASVVALHRDDPVGRSPDRHEWFDYAEVIAWPPTRPGRRLTDIFDGL